MAALSPSIINTWVSSLENIDWFNFSSLGLNALRHHHTFPIRQDILRAAVACWDSELHVFRFGIQELCPTVEEFQAYLGGNAFADPVTPPIRQIYTLTLRSKLGLGDGATRFLIRDGALNILRLFADYGPTGDLSDFTVKNRCMFALCMCLLALHLLVSANGRPSPAIVGVAAQIEQRRDVVPLVLAETIMGLDVVKAGRTNGFAGSPLLLQMWLCDKARLLREPASDWVYEPRGWVNRPFVHDEADEDDWGDYFRSLGEDNIAWRCHWLPLPDMTAHHMGDTWVVLAGLQGYAYYFPQRILRQFGICQEMEFSYPANFRLPEFKHSVLEAYRRNWENRVIWACDQYPTIHLDGRYRQWIRREMRTRRN